MSSIDLTTAEKKVVSKRLQQTLRTLAPGGRGVPRWLVDFFAKKTLHWLFSGRELPLFSRDELRNHYILEHPDERKNSKLTEAERERRLADNIDKALTDLSNRLAQLADTTPSSAAGTLVSLKVDLRGSTYELQLSGFVSARRSGLDFPDDERCGLLVRLVAPTVEAASQPSSTLTASLRPWWSRWLTRPSMIFLLTTLTFLGLATIAVILYVRHRSSPALPNSIAVLSFRNDSGRTDTMWLAKAVPEMLASVLAVDGKHPVATGDDVDRVTADLSLSSVGEPPANVLRQIQKHLYVEYLVTGSYKVLDPASGLLSVDIRIIKIGDSHPSRQAFATGTPDQLFTVAKNLAQKAGFDPLSSGHNRTVQASFPTSARATMLYVEGLTRLRRHDALGARQALTHATQVEYAFPLAHYALSKAYSELGLNSLAIAEARAAIDLASRGPFTDEQKLELQSRLHAASRDWKKVATVTQSLLKSSPNSLVFALDLVNAHLRGFRFHDALETIRELRRTLPPPLSADLRFALYEAEAYQGLSNFAKQREVAIAAVKKARNIGARSFVARGRLLQATASQELGHAAEVDEATGEARSLYSALGDRGNEARAIEIMGIAQDDKDYGAALQLFQQAYKLHEQVGDKSSMARVSVNIGTILVWQGRADAAGRVFDDSLAIFRDQNDKSAEAATQNTAGSAFFFHGDLDRAEIRYREALVIFEAIQDDGYSATVKANIGEVFEYRGDLENARVWFEDARSQDERAGDQDSVAYDDLRLGEIFALKGEFGEAQKKYQSAFDVWNRLDIPISAADAKLAMATLAVLQGGAAEAEPAIRDAAKILHDGGASDRSLRSLIVLADCLLAQDRRTEAAQVWQRMSKFAEKSRDKHVLIGVSVVHARILASTKNSADVAEGLRLLERLHAETSQTQLALSMLDVRLAIGQIKLTAGRPDGRQDLATLVGDAEDLGVLLVARRAAASLSDTR